MLSRNEFERSRHSYLQGGALEPTLVEPLLKPNVVQYTRTVSKASNLKSLPNYRRQARGRIIQGITEKILTLMLSAALNTQQFALEMKWREEDLQYREIENERRAVDDARRAVGEKAEQLKAIGGISALIAGFAVVVLTNVNFPPNIDATLLVLVGFVTAGVVGSMLISMLSSTFLLVAVYRYDCYKRKPHSFSEWWASLCKDDWELCFRSFVIGVPLFLVLLGLIAWVIFWDYDTRVPTSTVVSVISFVTLVFACTSLMYKWNEYLQEV